MASDLASDLGASPCLDSCCLRRAQPRSESDGFNYKENDANEKTWHAGITLDAIKPSGFEGSLAGRPNYLQHIIAGRPASTVARPGRQRPGRARSGRQRVMGWASNGRLSAS